MLKDQVSLCLTIGRRPDLLRKTLSSLKGLPSIPTLAINDFQDIETNSVFHEIIPHGRLIEPGRHLGHHGAVDFMYREVQTPYVFHAEDDWNFKRTDFLPEALDLLHSDPMISCVCFRSTDDIVLPESDRNQIVSTSIGSITIQRMDRLHQQWYGYTFNPHLARKALWEGLGSFSRFNKERHISRYLRGKGYYVAFLVPEACRHIGDGRSTGTNSGSIFSRIRKRLQRNGGAT